MTTSIKQLRPYILDHADILAVVLEDEAQMRPDHVEMLEIVRDALIWSEKQMYRRHGPRPRAPSTSRKDVPLRVLREAAWDNPRLPQHEIAAMFRVSGGRVNEALHGRLSQRRIIRPGSQRMERILAEHRVSL